MGEMLPAEVAAAMRRPENVLGRYILLEQLGKGGMGAVYKAWQLDLKRYVAVKFLLDSDIDAIKRFYREAQSAAKLNHPYIAQVFEIGVEGGRHFLVMEYIQGTTLDKLIRGRKTPLNTLVKYIRDAALGLNHAHRHGIVHRDVKPSNIMVTPQGRVYVMDFGLAKAVKSDTRITQTGMVVGTPSYMAPEQAEGDVKAVDRHADIWSLGATLYEAITSRPPFTGKSAMDTLLRVVKEDPVLPSKLAPGVPKELEAIVLKCLEKRPSDRYPSAKHLADDLGRFLNDQPLSISTTTGLHRFLRKVRRNARLLAAAGAGLVVLLTATFVVAGQLRKTSQKVEETNRKEQAEKILGDAEAEWKDIVDELRNPGATLKGINARIRAVARKTEEAHQAYPDWDRPAQVLAQIFLTVGQLDRAIEWSNRAANARVRTVERLTLSNRIRAVTFELIVKGDFLPPEKIEQYTSLVRSDIKNLRSLMPEQSKFLDAVEAYLAPDYLRASEILSDILKKNPKEFEYYLLQSMVLYLLQRRWEAYLRVRDALDRERNSVLAISHLAVCVSSLYITCAMRDGFQPGKIELAEVQEAITRATHINPDSAELHMNAALFALVIGKNVDAILEELNAALAAAPGNWKAMTQMAQTLAENRRYDEAEKWLAKAEQASAPPFYVNYMRAIYVLMPQNMADEAARLLEASGRHQTLQSIPLSTYVLIPLARIRLFQKNFLEAVDLCNKAIEQNPYGVRALAIKAVAQFLARQFEEALRSAEEAIRRDEKQFCLRSEERGQAHAIAGYALVETARNQSGELRRQSLKQALEHLDKATKLPHPGFDNYIRTAYSNAEKLKEQ